MLLLDEPLSALDAKVRVTLRDEIRRLQTELGTTTLFVTHDQDEALAISDRVGVMSNGRLEQLATPTEIYRAPASAFVARFVGSMNVLRATKVADGRIDVAGVSFAVATPQFADGAALDVLVRPEDVSLATTGAVGALPGTVTGQVFAGATTVVRVRVDGIDSLISVSVRGVDATTPPATASACSTPVGRSTRRSAGPTSRRPDPPPRSDVGGDGSGEVAEQLPGDDARVVVLVVPGDRQHPAERHGRLGDQVGEDADEPVELGDVVVGTRPHRAAGAGRRCATPGPGRDRARS